MTKIPEISGKIQTLRQQGLSNNQIIQMLTKQGYSQTDIFDSLNQNSLGGTNTMTPNNPNPGLPPMPGSTSMGAQQSQVGQMPSLDPGMMGSSNEEIIETIIEEKWNELIKHINKIVSWKNRTEEKIIQMEQQVKDMKDQFDELHRAVIGKIGEYDKNILNVGAEVKAMEKVFSNVLPVFVNNVKQLNDITNKFKVVSTASKKTIKK